MVETVRFELTSPGLKVRYAAVALRIHRLRHYPVGIFGALTRIRTGKKTVLSRLRMPFRHKGLVEAPTGLEPAFPA